MSEMPKWPEKPEHLGLANPVYWEAYERARAEAALARLRVAVKALESLRDLAQAIVGESCTYEVERISDEAIQAIGEIPEA